MNLLRALWPLAPAMALLGSCDQSPPSIGSALPMICSDALQGAAAKEYTSTLMTDLAKPDSAAWSCQRIADLIAQPSGEAISFKEPEGCRWSGISPPWELAASDLQSRKASIDTVCGTDLDQRIAARRRLVRFTEIVTSQTAAEAVRNLQPDEWEAFAPDEALRSCIRTAADGSEPKVMSQPFNVIVAGCEVLLGLPAARPEARWPVSGIVIPPESPS